MRRLASAALLVLLAAVTAASAPARDRAAALGPVACGTGKQFTYLLWPQGHPAIPSVNFQNFPVPHAELYKGPTGTYPDSAFGGFLSAQGGAFAKTCAAAKLGRLAPIAAPKTLTTTGAVTCSFPRPPDHLIQKTAAGTQLSTVVPSRPGSKTKPQIAALLLVTGSGATLRYDATFCKMVEGPKPPPAMKFEFQTLMATWTNAGLTWAVTFSGTSCGGDARGPWMLTQTLTLNGNPVGQPGVRAVDLTSGSGGFTILKQSDGSGSADAQFQVSGATITLGVTLNGSYSGLSVGTPQAQITATPVASC